ncbi:MAG: 16S rRNA (cytosine(1402)-N(4))-methyltransferase, partial [Bacteroidia bacterium]|nr:16S rRNA (cytosine(1402)-N(4))-methyltransferase [Bacteroidia bacterium]
IEVNKEMEALEILLEKSVEILKPGGRLVVMSYHSLEDRLVKNLINTGTVTGVAEKDIFGNTSNVLKAVGRKPIVPGEEELARNGRSRSAKLRVAEKIVK